MSQTKTACPDAEQLGAFIEGALRGDERDAVMCHLTSCRECLDLVEAAGELEAEISRSPAPRVGPKATVHPPGADPVPGGAVPRPARVVPFEPRRRARLGIVAPPLAAAAALALVVLLRPPAPNAPSPAIADGPTPAPSAPLTSTAAPRSAVDAVDLTRLPADVFPDLRIDLGFGGHPRGQRRCLRLGAETVAIQVETRRDEAQARDRLRRLRALLQLEAATPLGDLRRASGCDAHADAYEGAYAVALVRLAASTRDAALLAHPELEAGLKRASNAGLEGLPPVMERLAAARRGATRGDWQSLRETCEALLAEWR